VRFSVKKLSDLESKEKYHVQISNRFTTLETLDAELDINSAWETIREHIKKSAKESLAYYELKKHKPWFNDGRSTLLDQKKEDKLQW
jgi:phosphomevalonate kinase